MFLKLESVASLVILLVHLVAKFLAKVVELVLMTVIAGVVKNPLTWMQSKNFYLQDVIWEKSFVKRLVMPLVGRTVPV